MCSCGMCVDRINVKKNTKTNYNFRSKYYYGVSKVFATASVTKSLHEICKPKQFTLIRFHARSRTRSCYTRIHTAHDHGRNHFRLTNETERNKRSKKSQQITNSCVRKVMVGRGGGNNQKSMECVCVALWQWQQRVTLVSSREAKEIESIRKMLS